MRGLRAGDRIGPPYPGMSYEETMGPGDRIGPLYPGMSYVETKGFSIPTFSQRPFRCVATDCGKSYTRSAHLKRHMETSHEDCRTTEQVIFR